MGHQRPTWLNCSLSSCGHWLWHVTECTYEDPLGYSGEGRMASFLKREIKQMEEVPEKKLTKTLLLSEKKLTFVNSEKN